MTRSRTAEAAVIPDAVELTIGAAVTFVAVFAFRFLTLEFMNDHFVHLVRARQILLGDVPVRDFFDPGLLLQYYSSVATQVIFGNTLFGEALLMAFFFALGASAFFVLSALVSGSIPIAILTTILSVLVFPRTYSYPKPVFYALGPLAAWMYTRSRSARDLIILAAITVIAFLFRYDHGIYLGLLSVVVCVALHWRERPQLRRALAIYSAAAGVFIIPFAIFVLWAGVGTFVREAVPWVRMVATPVSQFPRFQIDHSAPWVAFELEPPEGPRVQVRWASQTDDVARHDRESRYELAWPMPVEGRTWSYVLINESSENVRAIVNDELVEDTHNIDRVRMVALVHATGWQRFARSVPIFRVRLTSALRNWQNAFAWFFYLTAGMPLAALVLVALRTRKARSAPGAGDEGPLRSVIVALAVLCLVIDQTLVRDRPEVRLADVAAPTFLLFAWLLGAWVQSGQRAQPRRMPRMIGALKWSGVVGLFVATAWSVSVVAGLPQIATQAGLSLHPGALWQRVQQTAAEYRQQPIDYWAPKGSKGFKALTRWVFDCTTESDRLLVTWMAPELFFFAQRGFAGGQIFLAGRSDSIAAQQQTVRWLEKQRVPIVFMGNDPDRQFSKDFPLVDAFVQQHFAPIAPEGEAAEPDVEVLVSRRIAPTGLHPDFGLPCYR